MDSVSKTETPKPILILQENGCSFTDTLFLSADTIYGCTNTQAFNYDSLATQNDGMCYPIIQGCLDPNANNYFELTGNNYSDPNTQCDNCCLYFGCMDSLADNYDPIYNVPSQDSWAGKEIVRS